MNNNTEEIYKQKENDDHDGEIKDKGIVVERLKSSTILPLYMTEEVQKMLYFIEELLQLMAWQWHGIFLLFMIEK